MTLLDLTQLTLVTGGQAAGSQDSPSVEQRVREELDMREREDLRDYERKHPLTSLICQGDRNCLRDARR